MKSLFSLEYKLLSVFLFLSSLSLSAQTEVSTYRPGITTEGITYFLPQTRLRIVVTAECTRYTPGEYAAYAQRFLDKNGVEQHSTESWKLTSIDVCPYGVADRNKAYTIKLNPKTSAPLVGLSPDGCLLSVNTEAEAIAELPRPSVVQHSKPIIDPTPYKTQEILRAGSIASRAELTAQEIYDIRENRTLLAKGQAEFNPKDGEQLRLMLVQLEKQETALLSLFLGTTQEATHVFTFDFTPVENTENTELFRFSKHLGLVDADDLAGNPIYISIEDQKTLPTEEIAPKAKKKEILDLRYCNPSNALVRIFNDSGTLFETTTPLAQFGRIEHLGGVLFNKNFNTKVQLSPITGRIERLDLEQLKP